METVQLYPREFKPALTGYIKDSLALLGKSPFPDDAAIHDIRLLMKRQRAAVRLMRPLLDEASYRREYNEGREVGRMLCRWREASVLRKTAKSLKKDHPELFARLKENDRIQELLRKPYSSWQAAAEKSDSIKEIGTRLTRALYRIRFMSLHDPDPALLISELAKNYQVASRAYLDCRNNPRPSLLHEFRKKTKTFLYQLWFFRPLDPAAIKTLEKRIDSLAQSLGKYNDLAQIKDLIEYRYKPDNEPSMDELAIVIRDRQDKYLSKVWPAAYRVFRPGMNLRDLPGFGSLKGAPEANRGSAQAS